MPSTAIKQPAPAARKAGQVKSAPDKKAKNMPDKNKNIGANKGNPENDSNGIMTKFLLLLIIVLLISMPVIMIRLNVRGIGEQLRPYIGDIKYLNKILPVKPDPNDPAYMTKNEVIEKMNEYKGNYEKAAQEVRDLTAKLHEFDDVENMVISLEQQKQTYEQQQKELLEEKDKLQESINEFSEEVKNGDAAEFRRFFEEINPELAAQFYERILEDEKAEKNVLDYVTLFEKMEQPKAAQMLEELYAQNSVLTLQIFKNMNITRAAKILELIPVETATRIAERLAEEYSVIIR